MTPGNSLRFQAACLLGMAGIVAVLAGCARPDPGTFATPEEAVGALHDLLGTGDERRVEEIFGAGSMDVLRSGDPAEDRDAAARVKRLIEQKVAFVKYDEATKIALFGDPGWPFPIPLVRAGERWRFDTAKGREELLNRRIGYYELSTLASLHAYVNAQVEYFAQGRDGNRPAFAQRFFSSEGRHDGLYWPAVEGENPSPLGDLLAEAAGRETKYRQPYHGYYYRILTGQGPHAPGGERNYLDERGLMTSGFAAVAWPAKYGNSGVMTFLVNQRGIVFQKDLGPDTELAVAAITRFDPDETWNVTADSLDRVEGAEEEQGGEATAGD